MKSRYLFVFMFSDMRNLLHTGKLCSTIGTTRWRAIVVSHRVLRLWDATLYRFVNDFNFAWASVKSAFKTFLCLESIMKIILFSCFYFSDIENSSLKQQANEWWNNFLWKFLIWLLCRETFLGVILKCHLEDIRSTFRSQWSSVNCAMFSGVDCISIRKIISYIWTAFATIAGTPISSTPTHPYSLLTNHW